jgi:hypothetical protein
MTKFKKLVNGKRKNGVPTINTIYLVSYSILEINTLMINVMNKKKKKIKVKSKTDLIAF